MCAQCHENAESADTKQAASQESSSQLLAEAADSPEWVVNLPIASMTDQLIVVATHEKTTAWVSMHQKDPNGIWKMIMSTPGFIGRQGLGKTKEGDGKTPVGGYHFTRAFGLDEDPGCAIPYVQADPDTYWSGDDRPGGHYNELVSLKDYPDLDTKNSERIMDYPIHYRYCLNISYNEDGTPGLGSAIFLHCFGDRKPFTGGCVAIPYDKMRLVMQQVSPNCKIIINTLDNLGGSF